MSILALVFVSFGATAETRVAFVVGNAAYDNAATLANPINDAQLITRTLERIGFEVTSHSDLTRAGFSRALSNFLREADGADVTFFYFAGHGMQLDGENFLLGTDATLESEFDVIAEGLSLSDITEAVRRRSAASLFFIDACRDNPLAETFFAENFPQTRSAASRGLAPVLSSQSGTMLVFAASPGQVALDGDGPNSPFSLALARHLPTPDVEILTLMKRVIGDVRGLTRGMQNPTVTNDLALEIYLGPSEPPEPAPEPSRPTETTAALPSRSVASPLITACDALAADPNDPERPEGVTGVSDELLEPDIAITACRIAVSGHPQDGRSAYHLARAYLVNGDQALGLASLRRAADLGYTIAMSELGLALIDSENDEESLEAAEQLAEAAGNGDMAAALRVAAYFDGRRGRLTGAAERAREFYRIAAEGGDADAMFEIGATLVSNTLSTEAEIREGLDFLEGAATQGHEQAMLRLSSMYFLNEDHADSGRAIFWLEGAANLGNDFAIRRLVSLSTSGTEDERDPERAARWIQALADNGDARATVETGFNFEVGRGVEQDLRQAAEYYFEALRMGDTTVLARTADDWPEEAARVMQRRLVNSFFYRGPVDGVLGPLTRASMEDACRCTSPPQTLRFGELFAWE